MMSFWLFLRLPFAVVLAALHALPWLGRPRRLFGVAVPPEVRYGETGLRSIRKYELGLLPWTCTAFVLAMWLPLAYAAVWMPVLTLIPLLAVPWLFARRRAEVQHLAEAAPSTREAVLAPDEGHLRGTLLFLFPLAILAGTAVYVHLHWNGIPGRFPIHWGADGRPNGWARRTVLGVYNPLMMGALIVCFMAGISALTEWKSRRSARQPGARLVLLAVAYVIAASFSLAGILPLHVIPVKGLLAFHAACLGMVVLAIALAARRGATSPEGGEITPAGLCCR